MTHRRHKMNDAYRKELRRARAANRIAHRKLASMAPGQTITVNGWRVTDLEGTKGFELELRGQKMRFEGAQAAAERLVQPHGDNAEEDLA